MLSFIQSVIEKPSLLLILVFLLFVMFMFGYMLAWFFKGGVIRFLLGLFLGYGIVLNILAGDVLIAQIAFAGGFLIRFFNWWQFLIRWQDKTLGFLVHHFETTMMEFLRSFFPKLLQRLNAIKTAFRSANNQEKTDPNQQSQTDSNDNSSYDDAFSQEQAKRAEDIKRERERRKNKSKQEKKADQAEHQHDDQQQNTHDEQQPFTSQPQQTVDNRTDLEVLGLVQGQTYTSDEIKKAYREQSKRVHPDKWQNKPQAIIEAMEREMTRVNQAYNNLK